MGGALKDADSAEMEARAACHQYLGQPPDDVTVL